MYLNIDAIKAKNGLSCDETIVWLAFHELAHTSVNVKYGSMLNNILAGADKNPVIKVIASRIQRMHGYSRNIAIEEALVEIYVAFKTSKGDALEKKYNVKIHSQWRGDRIGGFLGLVSRVLGNLIHAITGKKLNSIDDIMSLLIDIDERVNDYVGGKKADTQGKERYSLDTNNEIFNKAIDDVAQNNL